MKKLMTICLVLIASVNMKAQSSAEKLSPSVELHTRPISLLQGVITLGSEIRLSPKTSFLLDGGTGRSLFDDEQLTTFMVGTRFYLNKEDLSGVYMTFRHRSRFYTESDEYGANTNFMLGKKIVFDQLSFAGAIGVGRQTLWGETAVLPTWAVTIGYRLD
jgi:hypothetical protein